MGRWRGCSSGRGDFGASEFCLDYSPGLIRRGGKFVGQLDGWRRLGRPMKGIWRRTQTGSENALIIKRFIRTAPVAEPASRNSEYQLPTRVSYACCRVAANKSPECHTAPLRLLICIPIADATSLLHSTPPPAMPCFSRPGKPSLIPSSVVCSTIRSPPHRPRRNRDHAHEFGRWPLFFPQVFFSEIPC